MAIKTYYSNQLGAPVLSGTQGSLIGLLDAVLVNGFNTVEVDTMTREGTVVTVHCAAPHGFENPATTYYVMDGMTDWVTIAGADQAGYNGEWCIRYVSEDVFTFDLGEAGLGPTAPASPATGQITARRAPGGFRKAFAGVNTAAYKSLDPRSRGFYVVFLDDGSVRDARCVSFWGYEQMSAMTVGVNRFPALSQSYGHSAYKSNVLDASARAWTLYTDGKTVLLLLNPRQAVPARGVLPAASIYALGVGFGDLIADLSDPYAFFLTGANYGLSIDDNAVGGLFNRRWDAQNYGSFAPWTIARRQYAPALPSRSAILYGQPYVATSAASQGGYGVPLGTGNGHPAFHPVTGVARLAQCFITDDTGAGAERRALMPYYEGPRDDNMRNGEIVKVKTISGFRYVQSLYIGIGGYEGAGKAYIDITGNDARQWS